jgi:hypothetical protein
MQYIASMLWIQDELDKPTVTVANRMKGASRFARQLIVKSNGFAA